MINRIKSKPHEAESISLNKYISDTGYCSRREADKLIAAGRVKLNDVLARLGNRVEHDQFVTIDGTLLKKKEIAVYIALNKPRGISSTTDLKDSSNIISFIGFKKRIFPIGRLDKDSEGLILLTNNGDIVNKILRAGNNHEKEYLVTVNKPINAEFLKKMSSGVPILGTITKKCQVMKEQQCVFRIILVQGLNRQIRRMCQTLGFRVTRLTRVRIMNITLQAIKPGEWRYLTESELNEMEILLKNHF